nr:protein BREAST CANCER SUSCEPTIBILITY 2 homolog B-like isoform X1 [Ipomoea batatas]
MRVMEAKGLDGGCRETYLSGFAKGKPLCSRYLIFSLVDVFAGKGRGVPLAFNSIKDSGGAVPITLVGISRIYPVLYRERSIVEAKAVAGVKVREKSESVAIHMAFEYSESYQKL